MNQDFEYCFNIRYSINLIGMLLRNIFVDLLLHIFHGKNLKSKLLNIIYKKIWKIKVETLLNINAKLLTLKLYNVFLSANLELNTFYAFESEY